MYRLAPIINRLVGSEHKFITIYGEPITEEKIKIDHGSGKYRLYLNFKRPETKEEKELDSVELEILDMKFPPVIPPGEWVDDPRNKQWAWAKPLGAGPNFQNGQQQQAPAIDPLAAFGTFMDIQDRLREQTPAQASQPAQSPANDLLAQLKLLKEVTQPSAPAAPAKDPLELAISLMTIMNQQRAENPIVDMMRAELQAVREELKEARKTPPAAQKSFMDQLMEMATDDKMDKVKRVMGIFGGGDGGGRPVRTTPLELAREFISSPMGANIGQGVAVLLTQMMAPKPNGAPPQQYPTVLNQQNPNGTAPPVELPETRIQRIGAQITRPMIAHFMRGGEGQDFAQSMYDMGAEDYVFMRGLGADNIIARYRAFPEAWNYVQAEAGRFEEYIRAFCTWDPNSDEGPAPSEGDDGVVDLESQEAGS